MPFQDFREFLSALQNAGELLDLERAVSPELEVAKAMRKSASVSGPALIFKNNGTTFGLVGGVYNTRAKSLIALQTTEKDAFEDRWHACPGRTALSLRLHCSRRAHTESRRRMPLRQDRFRSAN
jgi:UbiD family decarboxylase